MTNFIENQRFASLLNDVNPPRAMWITWPASINPCNIMDGKRWHFLQNHSKFGLYTYPVRQVIKRPHMHRKNTQASLYASFCNINKFCEITVYLKVTWFFYIYLYSPLPIVPCNHIYLLCICAMVKSKKAWPLAIQGLKLKSYRFAAWHKQAFPFIMLLDRNKANVA